MRFLISSHFGRMVSGVAESDTKSRNMYIATAVDLAQTININENKKLLLCTHFHIHIHMYRIYSTHVVCILIVIQVKSMWKPQWINWMGQIALKFRFNKSLLICQKADGHFFLFFFFFISLVFFSLCLSHSYSHVQMGTTFVPHTSVCVLWPISTTTNINQFRLV